MAKLKVLGWVVMGAAESNGFIQKLRLRRKDNMNYKLIDLRNFHLLVLKVRVLRAQCSKGICDLKHIQT